MNKKTKIILDTDPGIDDAVAIVAALFSPKIQVELITTVSGNVDVDKTTENALKILEFLNKDVPIAKGARKPLMRELDDASDIHGDSGLDGYNFGKITRKTDEKPAIDKMREVIINSEEKITLVAIGPLTNIALLLSSYPEVKDKIDKLVIMGGSASRGNKTPAAEFNIYVDPESANIVFKSGINIVMCGLDITNNAIFKEEDINYIKNLNKTGYMLYSLFKCYRSGSFKKGLRMHDLCAIAYLDKPEIFKAVSAKVDIETKGEHTLGATVVDFDNYSNGKAQVKVCMELDVEDLKKWFFSILNKVN
ncbi:ribonucleoside hydrolase RihC [Clostridium tetani]|nr:ribonucleoside hydrolase RihC [Clostridium tetani]KGI40905.1 ribonucleoside hydrolase [Clostridium tetani]KGI43729.1 ribonucleoside hydrolase [Clostridium tetani]KHO37893.1 ribonucleoside hydrolase [Clostridium tetani]KIG20169.1 ribonucleoside hydrolase [Clostridium tetani]RXI58396.1 ribonucleoside hydrolase RihC [Clostridium tetani]